MTSQGTEEDITILEEDQGGHYIIKIESDVDKVCSLEVRMAVVPNRRCSRERYSRIVTEEEYRELGERLYHGKSSQVWMSCLH
jgi:hypothetical protein